MVPSRDDGSAVGRERAPTAQRRPPEQGPEGVSAAFWRLLCAEPLATATAVDVGTGSGRLALALAPRCRYVVGIDRDAGALAEACRRAAQAGLANVEFVELDAEAGDDYVAVAGNRPDLVAAHLCVSDRIVGNAGRSLAGGGALAFVAFHADQWKETGRRSRFAYDEDQARGVLEAAGFVVEHVSVERDVQQFASVEEALAAAVGLEERWRADGRWFRYIKFLEDGGRTLTRAHLIAKARKTA
jgi:SAM-dependent methyltransferase